MPHHIRSCSVGIMFVLQGRRNLHHRRRGRRVGPGEFILVANGTDSRSFSARSSSTMKQSDCASISPPTSSVRPSRQPLDARQPRDRRHPAPDPLSRPVCLCERFGLRGPALRAGLAPRSSQVLLHHQRIESSLRGCSCPASRSPAFVSLRSGAPGDTDQPRSSQRLRARPRLHHRASEPQPDARATLQSSSAGTAPRFRSVMNMRYGESATAQTPLPSIDEAAELGAAARSRAVSPRGHRTVEPVVLQTTELRDRSIRKPPLRRVPRNFAPRLLPGMKVGPLSTRLIAPCGKTVWKGGGMIG